MANPSDTVYEIVLRPVQGTATIKASDGLWTCSGGEWTGGRKPPKPYLDQAKAALKDIVPFPSPRRHRRAPSKGK